MFGSRIRHGLSVIRWGTGRYSFLEMYHRSVEQQSWIVGDLPLALHQMFLSLQSLVSKRVSVSQSPEMWYSSNIPNYQQILSNASSVYAAEDNEAWFRFTTSLPTKR